MYIKGNFVHKATKCLEQSQARKRSHTVTLNAKLFKHLPSADLTR